MIDQLFFTFISAFFSVWAIMIIAVNLFGLKSGVFTGILVVAWFICLIGSAAMIFIKIWA